MPKHEVNITQYHEVPRPYNSTKLTATLAEIVVKPPITPGESFTNTVLGKDGFGVKLSTVVITRERTVFIAESKLGETSEEQRAAIYTISDRIKQLADDTKTALTLMNQNPFPEPERRHKSNGR